MGQSKSKSGTTAPHINLEDYSGLFYEIARTPNPYQSPRAENVMAKYTLNSDGSLTVTNSEYIDGQIEIITGKAYPTDDTNSKLKVQVPIPNAKPFDYWILEAKRVRNKDMSDEDVARCLASKESHKPYYYSIVSDPEKKYVWILARKPDLDYYTYAYILNQLKNNHGIDSSKIVPTHQRWKNC